MYFNSNLGPIARDVNDLKISVAQNSRNLNIGHINAQSLSPSNVNTKLEEFKSVFKSSPLDIIGVSESWFKSNIFSKTVDIPGYKLIRNDRPDSIRAGGVCIYLSRKLRYKVVFRSEEYGVCESLFIEVFGDTTFLVGVVYLPNGNVNLFENLHSDLFDKYSDIIVMGDFNTNLFNSSTSNSFRSLIARCGLTCVHNNLPTHLCIRSGSTTYLITFL